jgi:ABC-type multidrug transport system ATPase subunit
MTELTSVPAIRVEGLVKAYGHTRALDGLDLTVRTGEVHGFLGPNGAGKTTTLRVLLGSSRPTPARRGCSAATRGAPPARLRAGRRHAVAGAVRR